MKPLTLQISGLNSFRQSTTIPFSELLKDGLFGIFGPTGSGKSTILDAITLALYGKVRRAPGGTGGIINMAERNCYVGFTFSAGAGAGKRRYTVERRLARNKTGGVETRSVRLSREEKGEMIPIAEKTGEVRDMVQDIIGINHDDFQRAVVLPQGAFAEFLSLETRARGAVLERLFGLHDLGFRLNMLLKERSDAFERKRTEVEARLLELRGYDDDALALANAAVISATEAAEAARSDRDRAEVHYAQASALHALIAEQALLLERSAARRLEAERLAVMQERIRLAELSAGVAPGIAALAAARVRYADAGLRYREATTTKDGAEVELDRVLLLYRAAEEHHAAEYEPLGEQLVRLDAVKQGRHELRSQRTRLETLAATAAAAKRSLDQVEEQRDLVAREAAELEIELGEIERTLKETAVGADVRSAFAELEMAIERHRSASRELQRVEADVVTAAAEAEKSSGESAAAAGHGRMCEAEYAAARSELASAKDALGESQTALETLRELHATIKSALAEIRGPEQEIATCASELALLEERAPVLRANLAAASERLDSARTASAAARGQLAAAVEDREMIRRSLSLALLAAGLGDGDACPLCGSLEHPHRHLPDPTVAARLESSDARVASANEQLSLCDDELHAAERGQDAAGKDMDDIARERGRLNGRRAEAASRIAAVLAALAPEGDIRTPDELRRELQGVQERGIAARDRRQACESGVADAENRVQRVETARAESAQTIARLAAESRLLATRSSDLERDARERRRLLDEAWEVIAPHAADRTIDQIEADMQSVRDRDRAAEEIERRRDEVHKRIRERNEERGRIDAALRNAQSVRDAAAAEERLLTEETERITLDLKRRWEEVIPPDERAAGVTLEGAIAARLDRRESVKEEFERARALYENAKNNVATSRQRYDDCWKNLCREEKARDEEDRSSAAALMQAGFADAGEAELHGMGADELRRLRDDAAAIDAALEGEHRRLDTLAQEIAGRSVDDGEVNRLRNELDEASRLYDQAQQGYGAAHETLRLCREKNVEWRSVRNEDILSLEGKVTADQLVKYLRGNGFIEYMANERLAEVCRRASQQLTTLTGGRFEVLARPKEGFIIRDHANDGGERAPTSLSGGETFLVSLSLALALSDTVQAGHAPLEFFFLDEGFGTLDNDLLETVMNTLERIRSEHRAIGVISHVSQLRERIARRLIVSPASDTAGTRVRFELA